MAAATAQQKYPRQTANRIPITGCMNRADAWKECVRLAPSAKYLGLSRGLSVRKYGDGYAVFVRIGDGDAQ